MAPVVAIYGVGSSTAAMPPRSLGGLLARRQHDRQTQSEIEGLYARLARARATAMTGAGKSALALLEPVRTRILQLDDCQLTADFHLALGRLYQESFRPDAALEVLRTASLAATSCNLKQESADAAGAILHMQGYILQDKAAHEELIRDAYARIQATEHARELLPGYWSTVSSLHTVADDRQAQLEANRIAYELARENGVEGEELTVLMLNYANGLRADGQLERAERLLRNVVAIETRILGEGHPRLLISRVNLAMAVRDSGQIEQSLALNVESRRACEKNFGTVARACLPAYHEQLNDSLLLGHVDTAEAVAREIMTLQARAGRRMHPSIPWAEVYVARVLRMRGHAAEAVELAQAAVTASTREIPRIFPGYVMDAHFELVAAQHSAGDLAAARDTLQSIASLLDGLSENLRVFPQWQLAWWTHTTEFAQGQRQSALRELRALYDRLEQVSIERSPLRRVGYAITLAELEFRAGQLERARELWQWVMDTHAHVAADADAMMQHPDAVTAVIGLGRHALVSQRLDQARRAFERAAQLRKGESMLAHHRADIEFGLARAEAATPRRSESRARAARQILMRSPAAHSHRVELIDRWLAGDRSEQLR